MNEVVVPVMFRVQDADSMVLEEPLEPAFRVGTMAIGYAEDRDLVLIECRPPAESDDFHHIQAVARGLQGRLGGVLDAPRPQDEDALLKTRKDDYPQVSVVPKPFENDARSCHPRDRKRYELKVPVWYARKHQVKTDDLPICPMFYGHEFGAELLATPEHPEPGHEIF